MIAIITGIIILACIVLAFIILVQNPKGGGLSGTFGSVSTQVMGVKQSGDIMEKGTWVMISIIGGLCILSVMFMAKPPASDNSGKSAQQKSAPASQGAKKGK